LKDSGNKETITSAFDAVRNRMSFATAAKASHVLRYTLREKREKEKLGEGKLGLPSKRN